MARQSNPPPSKALESLIERGLIKKGETPKPRNARKPPPPPPPPPPKRYLQEE